MAENKKGKPYLPPHDMEAEGAVLGAMLLSDGGKPYPLGYCVKCGYYGEIPPHSSPLLGAKPRWKFRECHICPNCYDEKGHFGILDFGEAGDKSPEEPISPPSSAPSKPPLSEEEARTLDRLSRLIIQALPSEEGRLWRYLEEGRGYPSDLVRLLVEKGYRWLDPSLLQGMEVQGDKVHLHSSFRPSPRGWKPICPKEGGLLIPVSDEGGRVLGFQIRRVSDGEGLRYKWLSSGRKEAFIPLAHIASPKNLSGEGVAVCEGPLKAEVVAYFLSLPTVGVVGVGRLPKAADIIDSLSLLQGRKVLLLPDKDAKKKVEVSSPYLTLARLLSQRGIEVRFGVWPSEEAKGPDDALLQREPIFTLSLRDWLFTLPLSLREASVRRALGIRRRRPLPKGTLLFRSEVEELRDLGVLEALSIPLIHDEGPPSSPEVSTYKTGERLNAWRDVLSSSKVVMDVSPSGSGKTKEVGEALSSLISLHLAGLVELGIRRVAYIVDSPLNVPREIEGSFTPLLGRTKRGWVKEKGRWREREEGEKEEDFEGFIPPNCPLADKVRIMERKGYPTSLVCQKCPWRERCEEEEGWFLSQFKKGRRPRFSHYRASPFLFKADPKTLLIMDDLRKTWLDMEVEEEDLLLLYRSLSESGDPPSLSAAKILSSLLSAASGERYMTPGALLERAKAILGEEEFLRLLKEALKAKDPFFPKGVEVRDGGVYLDGEEVSFAPKLLLKNLLLSLKEGQVWFDEGTFFLLLPFPEFRRHLKGGGYVLILDAGAEIERYARALGVFPSEIKVICEEREPGRVKIIHLVGLPPLWPQSGEKAFLPHMNALLHLLNTSCRGMMVGVMCRKKDMRRLREALEGAGFVERKDFMLGWWGASERSQNEFFEAGVKALVVFLPYIKNLSRLAAEEGIKESGRKRVKRLRVCGKFAFVVAEAEDEALRSKIRAEIIRNLRQSLGRLRAVWREGEELIVFVLGDYPLPEEIPEGKVETLHVTEVVKGLSGEGLNLPKPLLLPPEGEANGGRRPNGEAKEKALQALVALSYVWGAEGRLGREELKFLASQAGVTKQTRRERWGICLGMTLREAHQKVFPKGNKLGDRLLNILYIDNLFVSLRERPLSPLLSAAILKEGQGYSFPLKRWAKEKGLPIRKAQRRWREALEEARRWLREEGNVHLALLRVEKEAQERYLRELELSLDFPRQEIQRRWAEAYERKRLVWRMARGKEPPPMKEVAKGVLEELWVKLRGLKARLAVLFKYPKEFQGLKEWPGFGRPEYAPLHQDYLMAAREVDEDFEVLIGHISRIVRVRGPKEMKRWVVGEGFCRGAEIGAITEGQFKDALWLLRATLGEDEEGRRCMEFAEDVNRERAARGLHDAVCAYVVGRSLKGDKEWALRALREGRLNPEAIWIVDGRFQFEQAIFGGRKPPGVGEGREGEKATPPPKVEGDFRDWWELDPKERLRRADEELVKLARAYMKTWKDLKEEGKLAPPLRSPPPKPKNFSLPLG